MGVRVTVVAIASKFKHAILAGGVVAGLVCAGGTLGPAQGAENTKVPDFAPDANTGWLAQDDEFIPPPSGPGPIKSDPAHPYVSFYKFPTNPRPSFRVADLTNPILQPWTRERLQKVNDRSLSGKGRGNSQGAVLAGRRPRLPAAAGDAGVLPADPERGLDDLDAGPPDPPRLSGRAAFGQREAVLVRRIGRPLRWRRPRGRYHRNHHQYVRRQLSDAPHRSVACDRAHSHDRSGKDARGQCPRGGSRRLHHAMERNPALPSRGGSGSAERDRLRGKQRRPLQPWPRADAGGEQAGVLGA